MKKALTILLFFILLLNTGCTTDQVPNFVPTESTTGGVCVIDSPSPCLPTAVENPPALYGTWKGEVDGEPLTLTISETCVDLFFDNPGDQTDTEVHYDIQSIDWAKDLLTLTLAWQIADCEKQDGQGIGGYMKVRVEDNQLYYSVNDVPPDEALVGPLVRQ